MPLTSSSTICTSTSYTAYNITSSVTHTSNSSTHLHPTGCNKAKTSTSSSSTCKLEWNHLCSHLHSYLDQHLYHHICIYHFLKQSKSSYSNNRTKCQEKYILLFKHYQTNLIIRSTINSKFSIKFSISATTITITTKSFTQPKMTLSTNQNPIPECCTYLYHQHESGNTTPVTITTTTQTQISALINLNICLQHSFVQNQHLQLLKPNLCHLPSHIPLTFSSRSSNSNNPGSRVNPLCLQQQPNNVTIT